MDYKERLESILGGKSLTERQYKKATEWLVKETQKALSCRDYAALHVLGMAQKKIDQAYYTRYVTIEERLEGHDVEDQNELIRLITISSVLADMLNESLTVLKERSKSLGCDRIDVIKMAEAALRSTADMVACYDKTSDIASRMFEYVSRKVSERYYPAIENEVRQRMDEKVDASELGL